LRQTAALSIGTDHDKAAVRIALDTGDRPIAVSTCSTLPPGKRALLPTEEDLSRVVQDVLDAETGGGPQPTGRGD
jgi:hypothetical protein